MSNEIKQLVLVFPNGISTLNADSIARLAEVYLETDYISEGGMTPTDRDFRSFSETSMTYTFGYHKERKSDGRVEVKND